jgi:hypothetical protein
MKFNVDEMPELSAGWCDTEGYYQVKIINMEDTESRAGNPMVKIELRVSKGPRKGERMQTQILMPIPKDKEAGASGDETAMKRYNAAIGGWRRALMSTGMKPLKADKFMTSGKDTSLLEGKECFVEFVPRDEAEGRKYSNVRWKTPEQAEVNMAVVSEAPVEDPADGPNPMDEFFGSDDDDEEEIPF